MVKSGMPCIDVLLKDLLPAGRQVMDLGNGIVQKVQESSSIRKFTMNSWRGLGDETIRRWRCGKNISLSLNIIISRLAA